MGSEMCIRDSSSEDFDVVVSARRNTRRRRSGTEAFEHRAATHAPVSRAFVVSHKKTVCERGKGTLKGPQGCVQADRLAGPLDSVAEIVSAGL